MARRVLVLIVAAITGGGVALNVAAHRREGRLRETLTFTQKRLALAEADVERLRATIARQERIAHDETQAKRRGEIEKTTAKIRHLPFLRPVVYDVVSRKEIEAVLRRKLAEQYPDDRFENDRLGYVALGLLPPDYPLKQRYIELLGEQVAAFYDQHEHRLFMFEDASLESPQNRTILSHELTHALQDQHFDLSKLPLEIRDNDDRAIAASALIEGDATLEMNRFMAGDFSLQGLGENLAGLLTKDLNQFQHAPPFLRENLLFPYIAGLQFCIALEEHGELPAISAAYARPPASTAQVLHPGLYFAREDPVPIEWPDDQMPGKKSIAENTLGELGIRVLLDQWLEEAPKGSRNPGTAQHESRAAAIAAGWRGDRYRVYDAGKTFVWRTLWRTAAAATRFRDAIQEVNLRRQQDLRLPTGDTFAPRETGRVFSAKTLPANADGTVETRVVDARDGGSVR